jgi:hypothetical protein
VNERAWLEGDYDTMVGDVYRLGPRKARLFVSAACRLLGKWASEPDAVTALEANDRFADTGKTKAALKAARQLARGARHRWDSIPDTHPGAGSRPLYFQSLWAVEVACSEKVAHSAVREVALALRLIAAGPASEALGRLAAVYRDVDGPSPSPNFDPRWRTSTTVGLARGMYEGRDFAALPILADALEDAGCDRAELLGHLRAEQPHFRGCWAVDLVLGKT